MEEAKSHLFVISIVAIVGIVGIVLGLSGVNKVYKIDAAQVSAGSEATDLVGGASSTLSKGTVYCEDPDGWNTELKGTTSLKSQGKRGGTLIYQKTDTCETQKTGTYQREYYCVSSNKMSSFLTLCYNGCSDGACVPYKYASATIHCWDGYEETLAEGCMIATDWYKYADKLCSGRCTKTTEGEKICGWQWMTFDVVCGESVIGEATG